MFDSKDFASCIEYVVQEGFGNWDDFNKNLIYHPYLHNDIPENKFNSVFCPIFNSYKAHISCDFFMWYMHHERTNTYNIYEKSKELLKRGDLEQSKYFFLGTFYTFLMDYPHRNYHYAGNTKEFDEIKNKITEATYKALEKVYYGY